MKDMHIALLRGINVGGKHKLPMKALAAMFVAAGCKNVRTYIQSGNVVYQAARKLAPKVPGLVADEIEKQFGFRTVLVTRTAAEWRDAVDNNPFDGEDIADEGLALFALSTLPTSDQVSSLDPDRSPGDRFVVRGRDIYIHYGGGVAKSKLTNAYLDSRLKSTSTGRNWRTVSTLLAMAEVE